MGVAGGGSGIFRVSVTVRAGSPLPSATIPIERLTLRYGARTADELRAWMVGDRAGLNR